MPTQRGFDDPTELTPSGKKIRERHRQSRNDALDATQCLQALTFLILALLLVAWALGL